MNLQHQFYLAFLVMLGFFFACVAMLLQQVTINKLRQLMRTQQQSIQAQKITIDLQAGSIQRMEKDLQAFRNLINDQLERIWDNVNKKKLIEL